MEFYLFPDGSGGHGTSIPWGPQPRILNPHMGASTITYTILGVPHHTYSIMGPKTLF